MPKTKRRSTRSYRDKRDPARTNEPFSPELMRSATSGTAGAFVCHLHDATRRHWDLRLELGGVLKSFAIPRGPSLDPADKRLAVHTEDHPLEYLDFEAVIPEGNYGAGPMIMWDRGVVRYVDGAPDEGLARGKLDLALEGYKLRGRFALVRTSGRSSERPSSQEQWLLLKKTDAFSKPGESIVEQAPRSVLSGLTVEELPRAAELAQEIERDAAAAGATQGSVDIRQLRPMLCSPGPAALERPGWLYELKLDGIRILAQRRGQEVRLAYRTGRAATAQFPEVARAMRALSAERVVLDGEIVAFTEQGKPSFQRLARRIQKAREVDSHRLSREVPVVFLVFDLLAIGEHDLRVLPLVERKRLLSRVAPGRGLIRTLDHLTDDGSALLEFCKQHGLEGVVAKMARSPYRPGPERRGDWVKIKCEREDDFVVVGFTRGKRGHGFGALELATYADDELVSRGRVGTGFDTDTLEALGARLRALQVPSVGVRGTEPSADRVWVAPKLVASVRYLDWTEEGRVRHAVFRGLREDVEPRACTAAPSRELEARALSLAARARSQAARATGGARGKVELTNQDKIFWPAEGYTKGDLCAYYARIAPVMLPYLHSRPTLMVRYPDGIEGKSFYQWNAPQGTPEWVQTFELGSEDHDGKTVTSVRIEDADTLLFVANLGAIPLHILASRVDDLQRCDFLTIDFDVGTSPLDSAVELARSLHELLDEIGLEGYPKTSGQTGLHVLVPMGGAPFQTAKVLAELLGRLLHAKHPEISTMERLRKHRPNAVYIDTGQTGRSRSIVAPYSVRAAPGATVSTPLSWDEVGFALDPRRFTIFSVPERVERYGDPMRGLLDSQPDVAAVVQHLGRKLDPSSSGV